ncbi:KRAB-A domain-containing protein 2-like [Procambarus clarkii]|uniref:KRAB-A domain-containing protein 2-like n=1 Tax=Procambarus clarkii TaxID=6728 RepID=UPI00374447CD
MCPTTRFPIAVPVKNITAAIVVKKLLKIFTQYGFPGEVQSDCGTNFTSDLFKKTLEEFNITQVFSSHYHPASQGSFECSHQTIKALLKKFCNDTLKDYDKQLHLIMCIFRSLHNESLGVSPYEMLCGRKCLTPLKAFKDSLCNATFSDP